MEKSYTFIKYYSNHYNLHYNSWRLLIEDFDTLMDYHFKIKVNLEKEAIEKYIESNSNNTHHTDKIAQSIVGLCNLTGQDVISTISELSSRALFKQLEHINKGIPIIVNDVGGYMFKTADIEIKELIKTKSILKPDFNKSDIKITQFKNGTHWYAKLAYIDVVDENGNHKWDTWKEANNAAIIFLNKMK